MWCRGIYRLRGTVAQLTAAVGPIDDERDADQHIEPTGDEVADYGRRPAEQH